MPVHPPAPIAERAVKHKPAGYQARNYVPFGWNREVGMYTGPLSPATGQRLEGEDALNYWRGKTYFYAGSENGDGWVQFIDPQKDAHGEKRSWVDAPAGAPTFDMKTANAIRYAIAGDQDRGLAPMRPIDALLKFVSVSKMTPAWLRAHGAPEEKIPTTPKYEAAKQLAMIRDLEKLGAKIPDKVKRQFANSSPEIVAPTESERVEDMIGDEINEDSEVGTGEIAPVALTPEQEADDLI